MRDLRPCEIELIQCRTRLSPLAAKRKQNANKGKFCGRRDGSLRCSRSNQRALLPIIRRHPSFSPTMDPRPMIDRSIPARDRSVRRLRSRRTSAEPVNGSSQFPSCEIYPSPPKTTSSSRINLFSRRLFPPLLRLLFLPLLPLPLFFLLL